MTQLKSRTIFIVYYDEHMQGQWNIALLCSTKKLAESFVRSERKIARLTHCNDVGRFDDVHRWQISPAYLYEENDSSENEKNENSH